MKKLSALLMASLFWATTAFATTSTIDPTKPVANSSLSSAVLRANFLAAYNDIGLLWTAVNGINPTTTLTGDCTGTGAGSVVINCTKTGGVLFGSAATHNTADFLQPSNNLSELTLPATARANLGLATVATTGSAADLTGIVPANHGGTNLITTGAAGNCLVSNGTAWTSAACVSSINAAWQSAGWAGGGAFTNVHWDISVPNRAYAMSDVAGLWVTTDAGEHWKFSNVGLRNVEIASMAQSQTKPNKLAVISASGVSISQNYGASWASVDKTQVCTRTDCHTGIAFAPNNDNVLYTGNDNGAVKKSSDGGATWTTLTTMASKVQVIHVSTDATTLYIGTAAGVRVWNIGAGTYTDVTFSGNVSTAINNVTEIRGFTYSGTNYVFATSGYTLAYTTNNGATWSYTAAVTPLVANQQFYRFTVSLSSGTPVIHGFTVKTSDMTHNEGVYTSSDLGATWSANKFANPTYDVVNNPTRVYQNVGNSTAAFLSSNPNNNAQVFWGDQWGVFRSDDSLTSSKEKIVGLQNTVMTDIQIAPDGSVIASGMDDGMARSVDFGKTWTSLIPNATDGGYPTYTGHIWKFVTVGTTAQWKSNTGTIVACFSPWDIQSNRVLYSNANGTPGSWHIATTAPFDNVHIGGGMWGSGFCRSMGKNADGSKIWIGMDGTDAVAGIYYSTDLGVTWTKPANQPGYHGQFYNGLAVSPLDATGNTVLYAGFGSNGGTSPYSTTNGGATAWNFLNNIANPQASELQWVYQAKYDSRGWAYLTTNNGDLWMSKTANYGSFAVIHHFSNNDSSPQVDGLTFDPDNPNRAFASLSYPGDDGRIFMTNNIQDGAEATWVEITGNLPVRAGSNAMTVNPMEGTNGVLYVVTYGGNIFKLDLSGSVDWTSIKNTPTTVAGYGITDLATVATTGSAADLTGNLAVGRLNNGTGASSSTFWRGDGIWSSLSSSFNALASGTNTTAAMVVGSGGSLAATGTGSIAATSVPAAGVTGTLPITGGGTGTNVAFGTQANYPNTVAVSNLAGTSRIITNPKVYSFATGSAYNYTLTSPAFYSVLGGVPGVSKSSGSLYSKVPNMGNNNGGYLTIEFVVVSSSMDLALYLPNQGISTVDIEVDGKLAITIPGGATTTAQAGGASTITLAASSSSTNGTYNTEYVYITSGTGATQRRKIVSYVGATKVATVDSAWVTQPDATSVYVTSPCDTAYFAATNSNTYYPTLTFSGTIRPHVVRVTSYLANLNSIGVNSSGTVWPTAVPYKPTTVIVGDSYIANITGNTVGSLSTNYGLNICKNFGNYCQLNGIGGTGIVNPNGNNNLTYGQRTAPSVNSWQLSLGSATGGTFTLTQNGTTTGAVAFGTDPTTLQTALNAAFGANEFIVRYSTLPLDSDYKFVIVNVGTLAASTAPMTLNAGSLTGTLWTPAIAQYLGDIAPIIPKDTAGNALPFTIIVQGSVNDTGGNAASLQAAATTYFAALVAKYPTATILVTGIQQKVGPVTNGANELTAQTALYNATLTLPLVNGKVPWLGTYDKSTGVGYMNGSTTVATAAGAAGVNSDIVMAADGIHHTPYGHMLDANVLTQEAVEILKK